MTAMPSTAPAIAAAATSSGFRSFVRHPLLSTIRAAWAAIIFETWAAASALGKGFGCPSGHRPPRLVNLLGCVRAQSSSVPATDTLKSPSPPGHTFTSTTFSENSVRMLSA